MASAAIKQQQHTWIVTAEPSMEQAFPEKSHTHSHTYLQLLACAVYLPFCDTVAPPKAQSGWSSVMTEAS